MDNRKNKKNQAVQGTLAIEIVFGTAFCDFLASRYSGFFLSIEVLASLKPLIGQPVQTECLIRL